MDFIKISGFTEEELGQPHNIVRHPDMPAHLEHMWSTQKIWPPADALQKIAVKNGDHYWVSAYTNNKNGSIVEYQSVRTKPEPEQVLAAEKLYAQLRSGKARRGALLNKSRFR
ncbi:PAS domain-containing protein [Klebsiella pneumoniae]|nr:PAS domain-containing protein [Klebsiella pneumoniae]